MKNAKFMIVVFCLVVFAMAEAASAAPSVITTSGDHILVNGKPTFIVGSHMICGNSWGHLASFESCSTSVARNPDVKYQISTNVDTTVFNTSGNMDAMRNAGTFVSLKYAEGWAPSWWGGGTGTVDQIFNNNLHQYSNFFGYHVDEPTGTKNNNYANLSNLYNYVKSKDTNHPVMMNLCCTGVYGMDLNYWKPIADIFSNDEYSYSDWWSKHANTKDTTYSFPMQDYMYGFEFMAKKAVLGGINDLDSFGKPVGDIVQANAFREGDTQVLSTKQVRARAYQSIAMGYDFIAWWSYGAALSGRNDPVTGNLSGSAANETRNKEMQRISAEIKSLEPILLLPRTAYSWQYQKDYDSVSFSNNPSKYISGLKETFNAFNYRLIKDPASNTYYLIVVNKDANSVSTTITIQAIAGAGAMTAKTLGLETAGSANAGRMLTVNNGQFTDTFDGYTAHIYQICSGTSCASTCTPNWQCETPRNGYESDGCGNRRVRPACDPPIPAQCLVLQIWKIVCTMIYQFCVTNDMPNSFCTEQKNQCIQKVDDLIAKCRQLFAP